MSARDDLISEVIELQRSGGDATAAMAALRAASQPTPRADRIAPEPPALHVLTDEEADAQAVLEADAEAGRQAAVDARAAQLIVRFADVDAADKRAQEADREAKAAQRTETQRAAHASQQSRKLSTAHMDATAYDRAAELVASGAGYQGAIVALTAELADRAGEWAGADDFYGTPDPGPVAKRAIERATADAQTRAAALAVPEAKGKPRAWWQLYNQTREWFDAGVVDPVTEEWTATCKLPTLDRMVLVALVDHYNIAEHGARPGMPRLSRRVGCCENTARAAIARLWPPRLSPSSIVESSAPICTPSPFRIHHPHRLRQMNTGTLVQVPRAIILNPGAIILSGRTHHPQRTYPIILSPLATNVVEQSGTERTRHDVAEGR